MNNNILRNKIKSFIYGHGRGWCFSQSDLAHLASRGSIDAALSFFASNGIIRRVMIGLYEYPQYSAVLKRCVATDLHQAACALARKFKWDIQPSGETALNYLGLSTQVPGQSVYYSSGASKTYKIDGRKLIFKKSASKETHFKHNETALVVQALKAMGKEQMTEEFLARLEPVYSKSVWEKIQKDASGSRDWIYETIKRLSDMSK